MVVYSNRYYCTGYVGIALFLLNVLYQYGVHILFIALYCVHLVLADLLHGLIV